MTDNDARTPWETVIVPDPVRPASTDLLETPGLPELVDALADRNAEQVLYRVAYQRVGRRGGRNGSTPPPPLTTWAMTADHLAEQVAADVRQYLTSADIDAAIDLETGRGQILAGLNNGGTFTVERLATADSSPAPGFPPRGGHDELCAYAAGMSRRCTCKPTAEGIATAGTGAPTPQEA